MSENKLYAPSPIHSHRITTGDDDHSDDCSLISQNCPPPARDTPLSTFCAPISAPRRTSCNYISEVKAQAEKNQTAPSTLERRQSERESFNQMDTQFYKRKLSITNDKNTNDLMDSHSIVSLPYSNTISGQMSPLEDPPHNFNKSNHSNEHDVDNLSHSHFSFSYFKFGNEKHKSLKTPKEEENKYLSGQLSNTERHSFPRKRSFNFSDYKNGLLRTSISEKSDKKNNS